MSGIKPLALLPLVWGKQQGWVSVPARQGEDWREQWFEWPAEKSDVFAYIRSINRTNDVYWSPLVYPQPSRRTATKARSRWAWAELDEAQDPDPRPTVLWETSPGRFQAVYLLTKMLPVTEIQQINRRITLATGADPSGWDAGQVLRVPGTINHKYSPPPRGRLHYVNGPVYDPTEFDRLPTPPQAQVNVGNIPEFYETLNQWRSIIAADAIALLETPEDQVERGKRSDTLCRLCHILVRDGLPDDAVYALLRGCAWNKFRGRADEHERLLQEISKAKAHIEMSEHIGIVGDAPPEQLSVTTPSIIKRLGPDDWLCDYIEASQRYVPGANPLYHLAAGLALLATAYGARPQAGRFQFSRSTYILVVGPSRSGKSRTQAFAQKVLSRTDFVSKIGIIHKWSPEGLLKALDESPVKQVVAFHDEASGLFRAFRGRDYMLEGQDLLNELYNQGYYRKQLSKTKLAIENPCVTFYGLTTPEAFKSALSQTDIDTGFLARFLIFFDPTEQAGRYELAMPGETEEIQLLADRLSQIRRTLDDPPDFDLLLRGKLKAHVRPPFNYGLSESTLEELNEQMARLSKKHENSPQLNPILAEAGSAAVKVALLRAVAANPEFYMGGVELTEEDIQDAVAMLEGQLDTAKELYQGLGETKLDRDIENIVRFIKRQPNYRALRTEVQRQLGHQIGSAKRMDEIEQTMVDRGLIEVEVKRSKHGRPRKVYQLLKIKQGPA